MLGPFRQVTFVFMSDWIAFLRDTAEPLVSLKALNGFIDRLDRAKLSGHLDRSSLQCIAKPYLNQALRGDFLSSILKIYTGIIFFKQEHSPTTGVVYVAYKLQLRKLNVFSQPFGLTESDSSVTTTMIYAGNKIAMKPHPELLQHSGLIFAGVKLGEQLTLEEALLSEYPIVRSAAKKELGYRV